MKTTFLNLFLFLLSLSSALWLSTWGVSSSLVLGSPALEGEKEQSPPFLLDYTGVLVPCRSTYQRIVSTNANTDDLLQALVVPSQVLAYMEYTVQHHPDRHLFQGRPYSYQQANLEVILSWKPDLILVAAHTHPEFIQKLRMCGMVVFNVGSCSGVADYLRQSRELGRLLQVEERAKRYASTFLKRLQRIASVHSHPQAPRILYLSLYGDHFFGGGKGTSYHDIISYAGFRDVAVEAGISGYIQYSLEQVIALKPDYILCAEEIKASLQQLPGAVAIPALAQNRFYVLPRHFLESASALVLPAAEQLNAQFQGERF